METVSGFLDFSICSGIKDGGAAGLRCRFPSVLVLFSFPPLNPKNKFQKFSNENKH